MRNSRVGRLRRIPILERLEDRTVLSGNVLVNQNPMTGQLIIAGDNGNNAYSVSLTNFFGGSALAVTGSMSPVASITAINSVPGGTFVTPLSGVSEIDITEGNGTNNVTLNGFNIPGSIKISVGTGVDTFSLSNISVSAGTISFTAPSSGSSFFPFFNPTPSGSTDNISETNVVAGASVITTGSGNASVAQSNVTFGLDSITTGAGADTISVTGSMFHPAPRAWAIGKLMINSGDGNDTVIVQGVDVGNASITSGAGKNALVFDNSLVQTATIQNGSSAGAGTTSLNFSNNTVTGTGNAVTISLLNSSGIGGSSNNNIFFFGGGTGSIYHVSMDNVQFTNSGNLSLTVDDGVPYVVTKDSTPTLQEASTVEMHLVDTGGHIGVNLGNHFQSVLLGQGTVGLNDLDAGSLDVSIGSDNDIVVVTANIVGDGGDENVSIGDVTTDTLGGVAAPTPSVLIDGMWSNDGDENVNIKLGNNNNTMLPNGWPVKVNETVGNNLTIGPIATTPSFPFFPFFPSTSSGPNGLALNIDPTVVGGTLSVTLGNGGPGHTESLTLNGVTAGDLTIAITSASGDFPDSTPAGVTVNLINVQVTDPVGGMTLTDTGAGVDTVNMTNVAIAEQLMITLSNAGNNTLSAQNVTTCFGMINGGTGFGNTYEDFGGNFGYIVLNFLGH